MTGWARIDGKAVDVRPGETILQAAQRIGVEIPTLCHDPRVEALGACRLCVVRVDDAARPVAACVHKLLPGSEVAVRDQRLESWRKTILKLTVSENPDGECPKCRREGLCQLHALARRYGVVSGGRSRLTSGRLSEDSNPFIARDYSQCILCYRCTRVCAELEQAHAIAPSGRGFWTEIGAGASDRLLEGGVCTFCGQCVQTCPTGALTDRKMPAAEARDVEKVRTVCPFCGTGCGLALHVSRGRVIGSSPDWSSPASHGSLCVKGQFGTDFVHSPDRLTTPLVRENGGFRPVTWEEAYDRIAEAFGRVARESGPDAMTLWSSSRATNESNYLMQKFARGVLGTNNIDNCART